MRSTSATLFRIPNKACLMTRSRGSPYPFGQDTEVGALAPAVVEEAGFTAAFTTHARVLSSHDLQHPFHLPRVMLSRKAQSEWIVRAYHSGLPAMIRELWPRHEPLRIAPRLAQSDR